MEWSLGKLEKRVYQGGRNTNSNAIARSTKLKVGN